MMNKKLLFTLTMAAMLASCSSEDLAGQSATQSQTDIENAVNFEAYSQRGLTRSGDAGVLDNTTLSTSGFGVFGYKTEENYSDGLKPEFMYNEHVMKAGGSWTYEPVKYWSNAYGSNAQSEEEKKISFFAYAPYVENTPETGKVADETVGITGFTRNTAQGDPYVKYIASLDPTKCVDLCWGVCADADKTWNIIQGGSQTLTAGLPWLNVQRPQKSLGQKVKFTFKHALAQLNVQIDADIDAATHGGGIEVDANTKVFVRKVTFNGFAMRGALNLNNIVADQPLWLDYYGDGKPVQDEALTIYDGMRDGLEGTGKITAVESVTGLNPSIIQTKKWSEQAAADGVQKSAKNLFNAASAEASVYVIPTGDDMKVTIEYDIETADPKLLAYTVSDDETHGTSIPYKETRTVTLSGDATQKLILEAGKKHTVRLHLGVNTVMFDAEVSDWDPTSIVDWLPDIVVATGITLNKTATEFFVAEQEQLLATVTPVDVTDDRVSWTTSDATIATVDGDGTVHGVAPGTVTITATNSAGQTATCDVTVKEAIPATGISLNKTVLEMNITDADETLVATVTPDNATYKDVTWTSSDDAVATVDQNGTVHPVGDGTATITATVTAYPTLTATCDVEVVSDITAMKADAQSSNPLWKVAQYNVAQNKTSFVSSHSTAFQYVFSWADAQTIVISGYHVPTWAEQVKIIPSKSATGGGTDWFDKAVSSTPAAMNSITGAGNTQEKGWYIKPSYKNNVYAVRIVDGVLTAWHYQWVTSPCRGLQIDSYVLAYQHTGDGDTWTDDEMKAILALLPSSSVWTTAAANESPESSSSTSSRCTRFLPACGNTDWSVGSGVATTDRGNYGYYWSATPTDDSNAFRWYFSSDHLLEYYYALGSGFSVRLFHDD